MFATGMSVTQSVRVGHIAIEGGGEKGMSVTQFLAATHIATVSQGGD